MDEKIGLRLKKLRKAAGLTQDELSEAAGISQGHISYIERTGDLQAVEHLRNLAAAFHIEVAELCLKLWGDEGKKR